MTPHHFYVAAKSIYRKLSSVLTLTPFSLKPQRTRTRVFSRKKHRKFRNRLKNIQKQKLKPIKENSIRELLEAYKRSQHQLNFSTSDQILGKKARDWRLKDTFGLNLEPSRRPSTLPQEYKLWDTKASECKIRRQELYKRFDHGSLLTEVLTDVQLMSV